MIILEHNIWHKHVKNLYAGIYKNNIKEEKTFYKYNFDFKISKISKRNSKNSKNSKRIGFLIYRKRFFFVVPKVS